MHLSKLGLVLALGTLGVMALFAARPALVRVNATRGSLPLTRLPAGRRLGSYHLLTPGHN